MKKSIILLSMLLFVSATSFGQKKTADTKQKGTTAVAKETAEGTAKKPVVDFKIKPKIGELRDLEFPRYTEAKLKNGLKVFVIEDHKQPLISFRLQVGAGESMDGDKNGLSFLMTNLIYKGTQKRTAAEVSNQVDSVGASLNTSTQGELMTLSLDGLKKHTPLLLNIFSDVIQHPLFPKDELDKMMPQVIGSIKQEKSNADGLATALSRMVVYGKDHPSAQRKTMESVKKISIDDIRKFHERYVRPNNLACLAVVGDVTMNEILPQLEKAFANWTPSDLVISQIPAPKSMPKGVYFVERPGSVQSSIMISGLMPSRKDEMYEPLQLATSVLGSGFAGRLFKTLRETYSFTYTPFAGLTQGKHWNRFVAGAAVRNAVTDSSIIVTQREIAKVVSETVGEEEFNSIRTNDVCNYLMAFERSDFVASILQNAEYLGLSPEFLKGYSKRLAAYTPFDAQRAAQKHLRADKLYIVVVGSPDVLPVLSKYGRVYSYNLDLEPVADNLEKVNMSPDDLMKKVRQALGGADKLNAIQTLRVKAKTKISMNGKEFEGSGERKLKAPNMKTTALMTPFGNQEYYVNGTKGWVSMMGQPAEEMDAKTSKSAISEAGAFYFAHLPELGYKCEISGKQGGQIIVKTKSPAGDNVDFYYDADSFLLSRIDQTQESEQGPMTITERYENYKEVSGVKFAHREKLELPGMVFDSENSFEVNVPIEDKEFEPKK